MTSNSNSICEDCGFSNVGNSEFCVRCGIELAIYRDCWNCEFINSKSAIFCVNCGTKLPLNPPKRLSNNHTQINFISLLATTSLTIFGLGFIGLIIGAIITFSVMPLDEMATMGIVGILILMFFTGLGGVVGGAIGAVISVGIGFSRIANKTTGDYIRVILAPILIIFLFVTCSLINSW